MSDSDSETPIESEILPDTASHINGEAGEQEPIERNLGVQPLEAFMTERELTNHDLVGACTEPLTHKAVQRARKGRRLTTQMKRRITAALYQAAKLKGNAPEVAWRVREVFNY